MPRVYLNDLYFADFHLSWESLKLTHAMEGVYVNKGHVEVI